MVIGAQTIRVSVILLLSLIPVGCERPPTDTIIRAERLVEEAKKNEAQQYANEVFLHALESLRQARESVSVRDYRKADKAAREALLLAEEAAVLARAEKNRLRAESEQRVLQIKGMLDEMQAYAERPESRRWPKRQKKLRMKIKEYRSDLSAAEDMLQRQQVMQADSELRSLGEVVSKMQESRERERNPEEGRWK